MDKSCKYYKYQKYVSYDNGATWQPLPEFQKGELMEFNSPDCGAGIDALYKWVVLDISTDWVCADCDYTPTEMFRWKLIEDTSRYMCNGTTKCYIKQKQVSTDGITWVDLYPATYDISNIVIEYNSSDCGYE